MSSGSRDSGETGGRLAGVPQVLAAGGVIRRPGPDGPEVVLVHRRRQDDWSLPKGKQEDGEAAEAAALREVAEETGLLCEVLRPAGSTRYIDSRGRDKLVRYWLMRPLSGTFVANPEVDEVRWLTAAGALGLLSYQADRDLLAGLDLA